MHSIRRVTVTLSLALLSACGGDTPSPTSVGNIPFQRRFVVTNRLLAPITIWIDDSLSVILSNGRSSGLAVASDAVWLKWTSAKPADSHGTAIPDDIGQVRLPLTGIGLTLEITNVVSDTTYVTASVYNETSSQVQIGVYDGTRVNCVSMLPAKSGVVHGFTQTGYYRLSSETEMRAYRSGSLCTGPYVAWPKSQLADFEAKSGLVELSLTSPP